jgi:PEP-CTERM motif
MVADLNMTLAKAIGGNFIFNPNPEDPTPHLVDGLTVAGLTCGNDACFSFPAFQSSVGFVNGMFTFADTPFVLTGVPEPSTWAMLLIGFAGIGFASYRKSRRINVIPRQVN